MDELIEETWKKFGHIPSKCHVILPDGTLEDIIQKNVIGDPKKTVIALDFDQTLKVIQDKKRTIRGGASSLKVLKELKKNGATLLIVTAAAATKDMVRSIVAEVRDMGLDELFHVQKFDEQLAMNQLRKWGENTSLDLDQLTRKLIILISLFTDRYPSDLKRMGFSKIRFDEKKVFYRLLRGDIWSAEQHLSKMIKDDDAIVCPFSCWKEFHHRIMKLREEFQSSLASEKSIPDQLFLNWQSWKEGGEIQLDESYFEKVVSDFLEECQYDQRTIQTVLRDPAEEKKLNNGVGIAWMGNVIAARYNKPEGVEAFLEKENIHPDTIIFVDDNSDNTWNMFTYFAQRQLSNSSLKPSIHSFWYQPPAQGRKEQGDPICEELFLALSQLQLTERKE